MNPAEPDVNILVNFAVNQQQVGLDVALAVARPITAQGVVTVISGKTVSDANRCQYG